MGTEDYDGKGVPLQGRTFGTETEEGEGWGRAPNPKPELQTFRCVGEKYQSLDIVMRRRKFASLWPSSLF